MAEEQIEKIPIDAKLLTDAVIELNISRRSVGLYPPEHPIIRQSIQRAFGFLNRLFEIRSSITLGISKDFLIIDDFILDTKNPVFREFAFSQYKKGIIAITFSSGLEIEELVGFHELLVTGDEVIGPAVLSVADEKKLRHIKLVPIDLSKLKFKEGGESQEEGSIDFWGNYITALLEGKLAGSDAEGVALHIPPAEVAWYLNDKPPEELGEATYDRVITTYLKRKDHVGVKSELFSRFISMVEGLSPEIKQQLLRRAFNNPSLDVGDIDSLVSGLSADDMGKLAAIFRENASLIPESLRNVLDKLNTSKSAGGIFDLMATDHVLVDDIEIDENIVSLFRDDHFRKFVADDYKEDLTRMRRGSRSKPFRPPEGIEAECKKNVTDKKYSDLLMEMLEADITSKEDYLILLTKMSEMVDDFMETGRYTEITEIYNTLYSHSLAGRYQEEASSMLNFYFRAEPFIEKFIQSLKVWGRHNREGVQRLVNVQKRHMIDPLFEALKSSADASLRRFLIKVLADLGSDVARSAVSRLKDENWYVVRNMIYLIREAGSIKDVGHVRQFTRHPNKKISLEAVRTLVKFRTQDALSYMKLYLHGDDPWMREQAVRMAGMYRCETLVPHLLELLEIRKLLDGQEGFKILIVRALGEIGDPRALRSLENIVRAKSFLHRGETLKTEIFRSLRSYPAGSAVSLLELGLGSNNEEIRAISEELIRGKAD